MKSNLLWLVLALVCVAYLLQLPTPLRLNTDAVSYLSLAASFNDGHGFLWHGHKSHFPSGYPFIVAVLENFGGGCSLALIFWNYAMMALAAICGLWLLQRWLNLSKDFAVLLTVIYLLSWATLRYALIPGSEMTYIAISFLCLVCLTEAETAKGNIRWILWLAAVALVPLAMSVRLVGVVLPPAVLWSLIVIFWGQRKAPRITLAQWAKARKGILIVVGVLVVITVACLALAISRTSYFREDIALMLRRGILKELVFTIKQRFLESASMLTNIPSKNVLLGLHRPLTYAGIPCLAIILWLLARRLNSLRGIDVYLIAYVCLLLVWPYDADVRFWLPVQLLLFGVIARELLDLTARRPQREKLIRVFSNIWIATFAVLGVGSIAWNSRLTYSRDQFSELWDLHSFRDSYRFAAHNGLPVDPLLIKPELVDMLRRFGRPYFDK